VVVGGLMIVALPVLVVGCGSSGPSTTTSSGSRQTGPKNAATAAFEYSRCMRGHGVTNFPDPKIVSSPGHQSIAFQVNPSETGSPNFKTASQACQSILPAPTGSIAGQQQARKQGLLAFARCMRAKNITGFPDPTQQGVLTLQMISAAGIDIHSRKILDTAKSCAAVSNGAVKASDIEAAENSAQ
jgi:hypothetical protein